MCRSRRFHGLRRALVHDAVVMLGRVDDPGVLDSIEESFAAIGLEIVHSLVENVLKLTKERLVAGLLLAGQNRAAVAGRIGLPRAQAAIASPRLPAASGSTLSR